MWRNFFSVLLFFFQRRYLFQNYFDKSVRSDNELQSQKIMKRGDPLQKTIEDRDCVDGQEIMLFYCGIIIWISWFSTLPLKFYSAHNDGHCLHLRMLYIARITFSHWLHAADSHSESQQTRPQPLILISKLNCLRSHRASAACAL